MTKLKIYIYTSILILLFFGNAIIQSKESTQLGAVEFQRTIISVSNKQSVHIDSEQFIEHDPLSIQGDDDFHQALEEEL
ncbi:MAG: hypothetical protein ACXAD7_18365 [Candidatus Kariarchaeaceae archaeon]